MMIQSELRGNTQSVAEMSTPDADCLRGVE